VRKARPGYKLVKSLFGKYEEIPEEWELKKIKQLSKVSVGLVINPSTYFDDSGTVPMITGKHVTENGIVLDDVDFITEKSNNELETTRIWSGDLVTMRVGYPGRTSVVKHEHNGINCASVIITRRSKKIISEFFGYLSNSKLISKQIMMHQAGGAQQVVNVSSWKEFLIFLPPIPEQQKIASILSNVDSLINQTQKEIEQTQRLKKGLMQKLLIKGVGKTSIKTSRLDSVVFLQRGHDLPIQDRTNGDVPVIGSNGIVGYHETHKVKGPGVVIGRSGTLGKVYYVEEDYWPLNTSLYVKEFRSSFPKFIYYLLQSLNYEKFNAGTSVPTLNRNYLHPFKMKIPESIVEQQKIASILSNIDSKIQKQQQYKSKINTLKKGLMQKLLTGKIRVKV
jgi:type I restriction enzyme S subunit